MRLTSWRGLLGAIVGITLLSCMDSSAVTEPRPIGGSTAARDAGVPKVVISQVYGGGTNSGAVLQNDYVELFNAGTAPGTLTSWSLQYTSATGTGNFSGGVFALPGTISLAPGQYYLVKLAGSTSNGVPLPVTADASGSSPNMSGTTGKIALVDQATGLACNGGSLACDAGQLAHIIDLVGFGSANFFEGAGPAPAISTSLADFRANHGCTDTNNNSADFAAGAPAPRNSSTTLAPCNAPPPPAFGPLDHIVITGVTTAVVGTTTTLSAELQDANNKTITDAAATYSWVSGDDATAHVVSASVNPVTISGVKAGGPVTITLTATSGGVTKTATPTVTVIPVGTIVPATTFVSEIHYDNSGTDVDEAMEIEGDAGSSLDGWSLVMYNGSPGSATLGVYATVPLSGTIPATCGARGVVVIPFAVNGIQNGDADGWALVNAQGQVTELKSYEGTFTALDGPAAGSTSTAIDADEAAAPAAGQSVQRAENGVWFGPTANTFGICNSALPPAPQGSVTVTSGKTQLAFGMQTQFFFGGTDLSGHPVTSVVWSTSNSSIITVDQKGVVTAKGVGNANLIATAPDGATGTVGMTVYLAAGSATIRVGHNTEFGEPADADPSDDFLIRRAQYTVSYNPRRGGANWVSWNLDASHIGNNGRCPGTCYSADTALSNAGITAYTTADWVSGNTYDRGHMSPSADWTSSEADNNTTFFLSNFLPQRHDLNAGPWEKLENALRDSVSVANGSREAYSIAGGIFANGGQGLGSLNNLGKVFIPDSTWKIAVITPAGTGLNPDGTLPANTTVLAVNMPNVTGILGADWSPYITSVAKIEQSTGYNFLALIAESVQCRVEGRNCAPTARITSDISASEWQAIMGQPVTFSGSTSSDPDAGDVLTMAWSIGGSPAGTDVTLEHTFATVGTYHVSLTVTDNHGASNAVETTVTVNPPPPNCGAGMFQNAADNYACEPAPAGTYVAVTDATLPTPCAAGTYQPAIGQSSCLNAPAGSYVPTTGSASATPCPLGSYQSAAGATSCILAPVGSYVAIVGATSATSCPVGMTTNGEGTTSAAGCVWLPPAALTQLATDQLSLLVASGAISSADASPISVSIDQAQSSIARGDITPARNQLGAAINKVQAAVKSGKISSSDAAALIAALNLAIAHI